MLNKCTSILLSLIFIIGLMPSSFAEPVELPVDCSCVDKEYVVYGDEQPQKRSGRNEDGERTEECFVLVDLDPILDEGDIENAGDEGSLGVGDLTGFNSVTSPLQALFQQSKIKESFVSLANSIFKGHTEKYHQFLDEEVFGKVIAFISDFETSKELEEYMSQQEGECKESEKDPNPKPECVIEKALCSYEKYVGVLFYETGQGVSQQAVQSQDTATLLAALQNRDQALVNEAQQAQQALDTAIAVYSQFFQTYRLHLRFKELIVNLSRVRNMTSYMRELVSCVPNKFVGVATTKCN